MMHAHGSFTFKSSETVLRMRNWTRRASWEAPRFALRRRPAVCRRRDPMRERRGDAQEHFGVLKFTFIELETKLGFMQHLLREKENGGLPASGRLRELGTRPLRSVLMRLSRATDGTLWPAEAQCAAAKERLQQIKGTNGELRDSIAALADGIVAGYEPLEARIVELERLGQETQRLQAELAQLSEQQAPQLMVDDEVRERPYG